MDFLVLANSNLIHYVAACTPRCDVYCTDNCVTQCLTKCINFCYSVCRTYVIVTPGSIGN